MRSRFAIALLVALLLSCVTPLHGWAASGCANGGKPRPDDGGIGGTGNQPSSPIEDEGGVGGTGISAQGGVGIIGTITGFGSICVGGTEIRYDATSSVLVDAEPARPDQLQVGQVVEVVAGGSGGDLTAQSISVDHVVVGPVTRVDPENNLLEVMGQTVALAVDRRSYEGEAEPAVAAADFSPGAVVAVSGLRRADGVIVASLIVPATVGSSRAVGPVTEVDGQQFVMAGTRVSAPASGPLAVGDEVRVAGRWDGRELLAASAERVSRVPFGGRVARVEIEGYANREASGALRVGAFVVELPRDQAGGMLQGVDTNAPVRVDAIVQGLRVVAERIGPPLGPLPVPGPGDAVERWRDDAGARQRGARGPTDPHGNPQPGDMHGPMANRPDPAGAYPERPQRPDRQDRLDRPDRPAAVDLPERPPRIDRPPRPDRPPIPDRPPRPDRPEIPHRP